MTTVALGDVCSITMGQAPSGESYNTAGEGLPLVAGAGDFAKGRIAANKFTSKPLKVCRPGDVVLSIRASIGAKAWADREYCLGRGVAGLRPHGSLDARYLWHWLSRYEALLVAKGRGATFLQVNRTDIAELPVELPPMGEQRRIAAILDRVDALIDMQNRSALLADQLSRAAFARTFGQPMDKVNSWPCVKLGNLARIVRGASPRPAGDPRYFGGAIPWLKISDVTASSGRVVHEIKQGVTEAGQERSVLLPPETLILTNSATVGIAKVIEPATCIHDGFLAFLDIDDERVDQTWLWAALRASRERLVALAPEGTQKNLNGPIVKAVEVSLPPLSMQRAFSRELRSVEAMASAHVRALSELRNLRASLQTRAFSGQL